MKLIYTLSSQDIHNLIRTANKRIYISLPSIDEKLADSLVNLGVSNITQLVIDNSEESIRNGFGEQSGIDRLMASNFAIHQSDGNMISFIIVDQNGFFIFPQSKIFQDEPQGPNAYKLDPVTIQLLIQNYFKSEISPYESGLLDPEAVETANMYFEKVLQEIRQNGFDNITFPLDKTKYEEIRQSLLANPPLSPDLQRQINTYTAKIQFVELKFKGGNLENRIAQLPKKAIPINSEELRNLLLTRIKMFHDISDHPEYKSFQSFKEKIDTLRLQYLIPITCRPGKNIVKMEDKIAFLEELKSLKTESKVVTSSLTSLLDIGQLNTKDLLRKELQAFFKINEPSEVKNFQTKDYKEKKINDIIDKIVASAKFSPIDQLIKRITLEEHFYDLTWNDFKDEELHHEFLEKGIMGKDEIESIVSQKKAYEVKK